jgi:hypothetical protein
MSSDIFCYQSWYSSTSSDVIKPKVGESAHTVDIHDISWWNTQETATLAMFSLTPREPKFGQRFPCGLYFAGHKAVAI